MVSLQAGYGPEYRAAKREAGNPIVESGKNVEGGNMATPLPIEKTMIRTRTREKWKNRKV